MQLTTDSPIRTRAAQVLTALAAALLILCIVSPDPFPPWTSFHTEAPGFLAAAALLAACALRGPARLTPPVLVLLALALTPWLQLATGLLPYAGDAWVATVYILTLAAAWWWASNERSASETPATLDLLIGCVLVMALVASWQALAQWLQVELAYGGWVYRLVMTARSSGNIGQPNQLGTLLLMGAAGCAIWMIRGRLGLVAGWVLLLLFGWCLGLTQSRTALLSAVVLVGCMVAVGFVKPSMRRWTKHAVAWFAFLLLANYLLQAVHWEFARQAVGTDVTRPLGLRTIMWSQLVAALAAQPWAGYGWLQVSSAQQLGAAFVQGTEQTNYAHNILLDAGVMLGVPLALVLVAAFLVWILPRLGRLLEGDGTAAAALVLVLPWAIHSMLELPHAYSYFLVPVGIALGLFQARTDQPGKREWAVPQPAAFAAAALFAVLLAALGSEYASVEEDFRVNRFENRRLGQTPADYVAPPLQLLTQYRDMLRAMRLRAAPGMPPEDLEVLVRTARRYTWAPMEYRAALALTLNGQPEEAQRRLLVIRNLFPPQVVDDGRENWTRVQQEQYPQLSTVPFP